MSSEVKANKLSPATGTDVVLGDASDTFTIPASATLSIAGTIDASSGTATGFGKVLQQVSSLYATHTSTGTTIPIDDTIPQNTEGLEVTTLAITPESATSKLHIQAWVYGGSSAAAYVMGALFVDTTADAIAAIAQHKPTAQSSGSIYFATVVDSSSTVARTYKLRAGTNSGTFYINGSYSGRKFGGVATSGLVITEVEV